jgi:hypothetical protein
MVVWRFGANAERSNRRSPRGWRGKESTILGQLRSSIESDLVRTGRRDASVVPDWGQG